MRRELRNNSNNLFIQDDPGEAVPEKTFTHVHILSLWILYNIFN